MADEGFTILPNAESLHVFERWLERPAIAVAVEREAKSIGFFGNGQPDFEPIATVRFDGEKRAGLQVKELGTGQFSGLHLLVGKGLLALLQNPLQGRELQGVELALDMIDDSRRQLLLGCQKHREDEQEQRPRRCSEDRRVLKLKRRNYRVEMFIPY